MLFLLPFVYSSCGGDEPDNGESNMTDVAVTGSVSNIGSMHAQISGVVNLEIITAAYTNVEIGIEYSTVETFQDKQRIVSNSLTGRSFSIQLWALHPETKYYYRTFVNVSSLSYDYYGETRAFSTKKTTEKDMYIDLGLPSGTLWATINVGASAPDESGSYFAWGEIAPKGYYSWSSYKWRNGSGGTMTKYCTNSSDGTVDNKTELDPEDDAAYMNWGPSWRMPTSEQMYELYDKCTWTWTTLLYGVAGQLVTGPNGNSIFLPAAGYRWDESLFEVSRGFYWTRTLGSEDSRWALILEHTRKDIRYYNAYYRFVGCSVRPVRVSQN